MVAKKSPSTGARRKASRQREIIPAARKAKNALISASAIKQIREQLLAADIPAVSRAELEAIPLRIFGTRFREFFNDLQTKSVANADQEAQRQRAQTVTSLMRSAESTLELIRSAVSLFAEEIDRSTEASAERLDAGFALEDRLEETLAKAMEGFSSIEKFLERWRRAEGRIVASRLSEFPRGSSMDRVWSDLGVNAESFFEGIVELHLSTIEDSERSSLAIALANEARFGKRNS
jgi:hypothetical protein